MTSKHVYVPVHVVNYHCVSSWASANQDPCFVPFLQTPLVEVGRGYALVIFSTILATLVAFDELHV